MATLGTDRTASTGNLPPIDGNLKTKKQWQLLELQEVQISLL